MGSGWSRDQQDLQRNQKRLSNTSPQHHHNDHVTVHYEEPINKIKPQSTKTNKTTEATKQDSFPHNYEEILKDAEDSVDRSSTEKLYDQLYAGVFLNQNHMRYWVDKKSNGNCFKLYARSLSINWGEDSRYWYWPLVRESVRESSNVLLPVAELLDVCWLEVHGKFNTVKLTPGITYEVAFSVMLKDRSYGWEYPVTIRLTLPDGSSQDRQEKNMMGKPRTQWFEIPAGQFTTPEAEKNGDIDFSLHGYEGGMWKRGLVIKAAILRPSP